MVFLYNIIQADKKNAQADKINIRAFEKVAAAEEMKNKQQAETEASMQRLANRKKGILNTSITEFIGLYEQILAIDFQESDGVKELWANQPPAFLQEMRTLTTVAGKTMTDGQAIAVFLVSGITGIIHQEAKQNLSLASMRNRQADVVESQAETIVVMLDAVKQRADRIADILAKMNLFLRKSMSTTKAIIEEKGNDRSRYTRDDKEKLRACVIFATSVKKMLDTPLLDEAGELTIQSMEAIRAGETYLGDMNRLMI